jgi:putative protein kinase ArgK-like GTPase of G3E family
MSTRIVLTIITHYCSAVWRVIRVRVRVTSWIIVKTEGLGQAKSKVRVRVITFWVILISYNNDNLYDHHIKIFELS